MNHHIVVFDKTIYHKLIEEGWRPTATWMSMDRVVWAWMEK